VPYFTLSLKAERINLLKGKINQIIKVTSVNGLLSKNSLIIRTFAVMNRNINHQTEISIYEQSKQKEY
jgi:hypothetical protein